MANQHTKVKLYIENDEQICNDEIKCKEITKIVVSDILQYKLPKDIFSLDRLIKDIIEDF